MFPLLFCLNGSNGCTVFRTVNVRLYDWNAVDGVGIRTELSVSICSVVLYNGVLNNYQEEHAMNRIGERIKKLRKAAGLSQRQLAENLGISIKSIQRYEKNENPDSVGLEKLVDYFGMSSDYLLGLMGSKELATEEEKMGLEEHQFNLYAQYLKCRNHYTIDEDADYYWISLTEEGAPGGMAEWGADKNDSPFTSLRPVIPGRAIEMCTQVYGKPMVVNTQEDVLAFLIYGGHAIVKADIYEKHLKRLYVMEEVV